MIVEPKVREFICTTAHPKGCEANVMRQIEYVKSKGHFEGPDNALIIGASTGYGLASRISLAFGCGTNTIGVMYEKAATEKRTATPGWYQTAAFERIANKDLLLAKTINGDAFSDEIKAKVIDTIKQTVQKIDCVIYSLAAPRRVDYDGTVYQSALKTTDKVFTEKSLDLKTNEIIEKSIYPANGEEILSTMKVMGGDDWRDWIIALNEAGVLSKNVMTIAYSYIGPELTYPVYHKGTIGIAKRHLATTAKNITEMFDNVNAYISVNKALVTQASSAIPIVPLYFAILYKVMKKHGTHEGCIEQTTRLFKDKIKRYDIEMDEEGRIRLDDWELDPQVQAKVMESWAKVNSDNVAEIADLTGYWDDFYRMFGFGIEGVDYSEDVEINVPIQSVRN